MYFFLNLIILKNRESGAIPNLPGEHLLKYLLKYLSWATLGWGYLGVCVLLEVQGNQEDLFL